MPDQQTGVPFCEVELQKDVTGTDVGFAKVTTDEQGNFYVTNLEANNESWGYRIIAKKGDWGQSVTQHFSVMEGTSTVVTVRIFPAIGRMTVESDKAVIDADEKSRANIVIKLYDIDGKPVPDNMHVVVTQESYYPLPGRFIAGDQNGTELLLPTEGGKVQVQYGDIPFDTLSRSVRLKADCVQSPGSGSANISINLVKPNTITGTVYDLAMRPVPYAGVYLAKWDGVGKFTGYNSTEIGNSTDGSGRADANGTYRFSIMPAGDYMVTANESWFNNSSRVQVIQGTYKMDIILPLSRGSIKGYVSDSAGAMVPGVKVTLFRVYQGKLSAMGNDTSDEQGSFSFDDIWYGNYNLQAVAGDETADLPVVLDTSKTSAAMSLRKAYNASVPMITATPGVNATPEITARPTVPANTTGKSVTPKPPTPTPFPITPENLLKTYGVIIIVIGIICAGIVLLAMRVKPKQ